MKIGIQKLRKFTIALTIVVSWIFIPLYSYSQDAPTLVQPLEPLQPIIPIPVDSIAKVDYPVFPDEVLESRLKNLEKDITLTYNKTIRGFINYFTIRNRRYALVMARRKNIYFPIFEAALKRHGMPEELKYLAIVESGLNPRASSRVGAAGLWQFMPGTGRELNLHQDEFIDERLDPYKSTEAACVYLKTLYNIFGDWQLALAAYNCGPGTIRRAIRRSGYKDSFWEVYNFLPQETRSYVPQFVALTYVMNHLEDHAIIADSIEYPIEFDTIIVTRPINVEVLCSNLNICPEDFLKLNPALKKSVFPGHQNFALRIPSDKIDFLRENRVSLLDTCGKYCEMPAEYSIVSSKDVPKPAHVTSFVGKKKTIHIVKRGEVLNRVAAKYKVSVADLKDWNNLKGTKLKAGQRLIVYKEFKPKSSISATTKDKTIAKNVRKPRVYYVQPGDTLWTISKKHNGLTVDMIKKLNKLKSNELKIGQKLIVG